MTSERDELIGKVLYLEKSLDAKEKENDEIFIKNSDLQNELKTLKEEMETIVKRNNEEVARLRTQIQFQEEQQRANCFTECADLTTPLTVGKFYFFWKFSLEKFLKNGH